LRISLTRIGLVTAGVLVAGIASAQSIDVWYNVTGNTAHSSTINATAGGTLNLTVYFQTTGFAAVGGMSQLGALLGIGSSTTSGIGAVNTDGRLTVATGPTYSASPVNFNSFDLQHGVAGGSGPASGTTRPWGPFADTFALSGNMGTADGVIYSYYNVTLNVSAGAVGQTIAVPIWVDNVSTNPGPYSTYASTGTNQLVRAQGFTANIVVSGVPEPATMAALGLGAVALIRRRRRK